MTANRKWFLDITPILEFQSDGSRTEMGTVRYEVDDATLGVASDIPAKMVTTGPFITGPYVLGSHFIWSRVMFRIDVKSAEVPQPQQIPGNPVPMIGMHEHDPRSHVSPETRIPRARGIAPRNSDDER